MKVFDPPPMRTVLGQLIEHANWASRSWVDATMNAMGEAIRETGSASREVVDEVERAESAGDPAERERVLLSALESCRDNDELQALGQRFMKLREQFRPIWSAEASASNGR